MTLNPLGFVLIDDGGCPRTFSGRAKEVISGGQFVYCSGAAAVVGSAASSFAYGDLEVATGASGNQVNGIAMHNAGSNEPITVLTRGRVIVAVEESMDAGTAVDPGLGTVHAVRISDGWLARVGRVLASATSGGFTLLDFNCA